MSTYAWAIRPSAPSSHRGGLDTVLGVLHDLAEILAFSYRLRTTGKGPGRSTAH